MPLLEAEARRLWKLYLSGTVRELSFRADRRSAVLLLEAPTLEVAVTLLEFLPLVEHKLIRFALIPLAPYTGFARLFCPHEDGA
jgi:hypothetical protein